MLTAPLQLAAAERPLLWAWAAADGSTALMAAAEHGGAARVISDCHFTVQLNHFIPGFLSYSVAGSLK
jgi:hypothetical protein